MDEEIKNEEEIEVEDKKITPTDYFTKVKERRHDITDEKLGAVYDNCLSLVNKYKITGQTDGIKRLIFQLETITKEREIVKLGITTFVYKDAVEEYIENISDKAVKIIELSQYEREIPNEIVQIIDRVKGKFDKLYVVFTDYTGEMTKKVEKERRDKDPILFGAFQNKENKVLTDRFYYLADWEDEFCDLTLEKMVDFMKYKKSKDIIRTIETPKDIADFKQQLRQLEESEKDSNTFVIKPKPPVKENVFRKIKTFIDKLSN